MKLRLLVLAITIGQYVFAAGYILPNGAVVYDGGQDQTLYKVDKITPVQMQRQTVIQNQTPQPVQNVIIEDRTVVYNQPVYIKERVIDNSPVYDVITVAGVVLASALIYNASRHGFYYSNPHNFRHGAYYR